MALTTDILKFDELFDQHHVKRSVQVCLHFFLYAALFWRCIFLVCNVCLQEREIIVVTFVIKDDGKTYSDAE